MKREKTSYPGVFYREAERIGGKGLEKVYYILFKRDGKLIEEKIGRQFADNMTPAKAARIRAERIEGRRKSKKEIREEKATAAWTVDRLRLQYFADKPATKGWTVDGYRYEKYLKAGLGNMEPQAITQMHIHRLRLTLSKTLAPQTVKHLLRLLARIINFGVNRGLCPGLKFKIEMPKVNNLVTEDLSPEQLSNLLTAIDQEPDPQAANFLRLILYTGLRRGELFRLQWADLDFDRSFINLREPKGGTDARVPLNPAARELLLNHPKGNSPYVFPGRAGGQRTRYPKAIDRIRERAGLDPSFRPCHGLRHFFASQLASSGEVDLFTIQKLLCHKSPAMTMRYSHLRDEVLQRASTLAGDMIGQAVANGSTPLKVVPQKK